MDYGLSTYLFVNERLSFHILDQIFATGLQQIEIFAARQHLEQGSGFVVVAAGQPERGD